MRIIIFEEREISVAEMASTKPFQLNVTITGIIFVIIALIIIFALIVIISSKFKINTSNNIAVKKDVKLDEDGNYTKGETQEEKKKNITFIYQELMKQHKLKRY